MFLQIIDQVATARLKLRLDTLLKSFIARLRVHSLYYFDQELLGYEIFDKMVDVHL